MKYVYISFRTRYFELTKVCVLNTIELICSWTQVNTMTLLVSKVILSLM